VVVIVFGVSGAGKTTVGKLLARDLGWSFYDADDFHPKSNIDKMKRGIALNDQDREPWLAQLRGLVEQRIGHGQNAVLACSALKRKYRDRLRVNDQVKFVFLRGEESQIEHQIQQRRGHFMNPQLLQSQFADLEEPSNDEDVIIVQLGSTPAEEVSEIKEQLSR
jgi:gluconokinase